MDRYPAAETIARDLMLEPGDTIVAAIERWRVVYRARVGIEPEVEMVAAARAYLDQRLVGVLPPQASASGAWPRVPEMFRGVGKERPAGPRGRSCMPKPEDQIPISEAHREHTWAEFRDAGLLWFVNRILHTFGWAIVIVTDDDTNEVVCAYPARCVWRGFDADRGAHGFERITAWMSKAASALTDEVDR